MELVFATNNAHKLEEVRQILGDRFKVLSLNDINCHEDIPETADTFQGNALQKARYVHDSEANMTKLLGELEKKSDRSAQFRTVVALILNGQEVLFEGIVTGQIATERHYGDGGFGYDPIFVPDGYTETFSQMSSQGKNLISHRGRAVRKLADYLKTL